MAPAFLRTEKNFRRIVGYRELWTLDGDSERIAVRYPTGRGLVTSNQPPLATFNYARDVLPLQFDLALA
jgi:hypothetical protein